MRGIHRQPTAVRRRVTAACVLVLLCLVFGPGALAGPVANASTAASGATVAGTGAFADLRVTVSQTANLINQAVMVSWTGGKPTVRGSIYEFGGNYLQIMQCWGTAADGPDRTQCQFGKSSDDRGGFTASKRWLRKTDDGASYVDPLEKAKTAAGKLWEAVPFTSVSGTTSDPLDTSGSDAAISDFDRLSTNEVDFTKTRTDGTGEVQFEVQTKDEASGLGCGEPSTTAAGTVVGRSCWLVVVPRGTTDVDGSVVTGCGANCPAGTEDALASSPLSTTNWANRIVVPLGFQPAGQVCTIGTAELPTIGQEAVSEAVTRWQPTLCSTAKQVFGFSQYSDDSARAQLTSTDPGLVFVSRAADPDSFSAGHTPVYAPVAISGLTIGFFIEERYPSTASADLLARRGRPVTELKLNARLVAKLITQSYQGAVAGKESATELAGNPVDLAHDQEFLALNPDFEAMSARWGFPRLVDMLVPAGHSDALALLWEWLAADPDAKSFLAGTADPYGMKINPANQNLELPRSDIPKGDQHCETVSHSDGTVTTSVDLCTLDMKPYAADMHTAARSAFRGDNLGISDSTVDFTTSPPTLKKNGPEVSGLRGVLALMDTATANRFGLATAKLKNAAGEYVAATPSSLLAAEAAMKPSAVTSVLAPTAASTAAGAYPLTMLSYAATVPAALAEQDAANKVKTALSRKGYAALLRYAGGAGQATGDAPGQLPVGYAPLPQALRAQTLAAASSIANYVAPTTAATATTSTGTGGSGTGTGNSSAGDGGTGASGGGLGTGAGSGSGSGTGSNGTAGTTAPAIPTAVASPTRGVAAQVPATAAPVASARTPTTPLGAIRYALLAVAVLGGVAVAAGPTLLRFAYRYGR